jgi:hypothetical protein
MRETSSSRRRRATYHFWEIDVSASKTLRSAFAFLAFMLLSVPANAQLFRSYLAIDGNDANPCTLPAPCRLLPAALAAVADGGEIWMLDSANYNATPVTIGKSVSILAVPGAVGSVLAMGAPAITIEASSLTVALRNIVIAPLAGTGTSLAFGVYMSGASSLTIERSLIANLGNHGVLVNGMGTVKIADTIIRNNSTYAVLLLNGAKAEISRTQMLGNVMGGIWINATVASTTTTATVSDSIISGGDTGVGAFMSIDAVAKVFVTRSTIEGTGSYALSSQSSAGSTVVTVSYSMITNNNYAWSQSGTGSVIRSLGNNHIADNTNTYGTLTPVALQ